MISFTVSQALQYLYCPRFIWYENVMGIAQNQELRFKVLKGREAHEKKEEDDRGYLRRRLGVIDKKKNVFLGAPGLPFRGMVDEILVFPDNRMAPLDWKYAEYREYLFETYKTQAVIYAMLIQEVFGARVERAFLVFTRSANRLVEIPVTQSDFDGLASLHGALTAVVSGAFPPPTRRKRRCVDCCYRNICPK